MFILECTQEKFIIKGPNDEHLLINRRTSELSQTVAQNDRHWDAVYKCDAFIGCIMWARRKYLLIIVSSQLVADSEQLGKIYEVKAVKAIPYVTGTLIPRGVVDVATLLEGGFYFSHNFDLTRTLQAQKSNPNFRPDTQYIWNQSMIEALAEPKVRESIDVKWIAYLTQGSVSYVEIPGSGEVSPPTPHITLCLIARKSKERSGTRYAGRGICDGGGVAGYTETELMVSVDHDPLCSHVQVRGSVPVFWEQNNALSINLTRNKIWSEMAFAKHHNNLVSTYGNKVIYFSLLSPTKDMEKQLIEAYEEQVIKHDAPFVSFDFHAHVQQDILHDLEPMYQILTSYLEDQSYFSPTSQQKGVIRTNCMDCLDRTNIAQYFIAYKFVMKQLTRKYPELFGLPELERIKTAAKENEDKSWWSMLSPIVGPCSAELIYQHPLEALRTMWANCGDKLSIANTGTPSILSGLLHQKGEAFNLIDNVTKTIQRSYNANFEDVHKQQVYESLVRGGMVPRVVERGVAPEGKFKTWVGTWNLAGAVGFTKEIIQQWISNSPDHDKMDFFMFCFEEAIPLTAQNVLTKPYGDKEVEVEMENIIQDALGDNYIKLRSGGMVGLYAFIFVRVLHMQDISQVSLKRHVLGTFGGNKGGIVVNATFKKTEISFVSVHLEAGKTYNEQRFIQLQTIMKTVECDLIIIGGDTNFRIDLEDEDAHRMVAAGDDQRLLEYDQFRAGNQAQYLGLQELPITFKPTYKFIIGESEYDPARGPAWTDRVFFAGHASASDYKSTTYPNFTIADHFPVSLVVEAPLLSVMS